MKLIKFAEENKGRSTIGTISSSLSTNSRNMFVASSDLLVSPSVSCEDSGASKVAAAVNRFDCTNQSGCGGSGSTVRCPSNRNPETRIKAN